MLIKLAVLEAIRDGRIDLQFRRWKRATVKPGGTLKTRVGVLQIGAIDPIRAEDVTDEEARRAGFADHRDFLEWLDTMKPGDLCRIEVSWLSEDPRVALRQDTSEAAIADLVARLDEMDRRSDGDSWTRAYLAAIRDNPARLAEDLAHELGMEKHPFKARVRRLKALGLTESLEVGYRLSPRGEAVLKVRGN